jgi:hypothetical protein
MSRKHLHIHSIPLVALGIAATTATTLAVLSLQGIPSAQALFQPSLRVQTTANNTAKIAPVRPVVPEPIGVDQNLPVVIPDDSVVTNSDVVRAAQAVDSIGMKLVLD